MRRRRLVGVLGLALVAASCGSGSGSTGDGSGSGDEAVASDESNDSGQPETSGTLLSADGRLSVTPPEGAPTITVEELDTSGYELEGGGTVVASYELGPDGSTFDDPVEIAFQLDDGSIESGVTVVLSSSDGTSESLEITVDDANVLRAAVPHFSQVTIFDNTIAEIGLRVPATVPVGDVFFPSAGEIGESARSEGIAFLPASTFSWTAAAPLTMTAEDGDIWPELTCADAGRGSVSGSGLMMAFHSNVVGERIRTDFVRVDLVEPVSCVGSAPVGVSDERCRDASTGEDRTDCAKPTDVRVRVTGSGVELQATVASGFGTADTDRVSISLWIVDPATVGVECTVPENSCHAVNGQFLLIYDLPLVPSLDGETAIFPGLPLSVVDGVLMMTTEAGEAFDGSSVEAATAPVVDATMFTQQGETFHTLLLDFDSLAEAITEVTR